MRIFKAVSTATLLPASVVILLASIALGQDPRGSIIGRVTDQTQALIPDVDVRVTNVANGVSASSKTNQTGHFNIPFLLPGVYKVTAKAPGFAAYSRDGIEVRVSETVELAVDLRVGGVAESVEVTTETPLLDTAGSSLGQVIDQRRVVELPVVGGNPIEFMFLAPGVMTDRTWNPMKAPFTGTGVSADGNPAFTNEFQMDGVSNTFAAGDGGSRDAVRPPANVISEFKVQSSSYDASIGHTIGAFVNVSTKSGTNELHGEVHYWHRNSAFGAESFFNNRAGTKQPPYRDHQWGASAGGPVVLPGLYNGHNKTFWYYAHEKNLWGAPRDWSFTVPTAAQHKGDFSELLALGSRYQIYDPATTVRTPEGRYSRQPLLNNIIPPSRLDPVGLKLVNLYPNPTMPGSTDGVNNYMKPSNYKETYNVHFARVDHAFSDSHRLFARVNYDYWEEDRQRFFSPEVHGQIINRINRGLALDDVFVLNPSVVLNVRYGITNQEFPERRVSQGFDLSSLGFSPALVKLVDKKLATIPRLSPNGYSQLSIWGEGDGTITGLTHSLAGNVTHLRGKHNLKYGADFRVYRGFGNRHPLDVSPDLQFTSSYTRGPFDTSPSAPMGQGLAAMLFGIPEGGMARTASSALQDKYLGLYFHDDFKFTDRLTLNLGLRYEVEAPIAERYDRLVAGYAFGQSNPIEAQARANYAKNPIPEVSPSNFRVLGGLQYGSQGGVGRSPFRGEKNNFLPRFGFAYRLTEKTTLRGGYGIFYDSIGVNATQALQTGFSQTTPIQPTLDNGLTFVATLANPLPNGLLAPPGSANGLKTNLGQTVTFYNPDRKHPYAQRWSFGLQRLLPRRFLLDASYVGNRGTRLGVQRQLNYTPAQYLSTSRVRDQGTIDSLAQQLSNPFQGLDPIYGSTISRAALLTPYPHFSGVTSYLDPIGYSWYHALQTRLEKRFSQGYTFQMIYTWAKLMEAVDVLNPSDPKRYEVIGGFDRTHRLAMSGIWEIPVGRGRHFGSRMPAVANLLVGGWQLSGVVALQSGALLSWGNVIFNGDLKDIELPSSQRTVDRWFNTEASFNRDSRQQLASNIRTFPFRLSGLRAQNVSRWDFSIVKQFPIYERLTFQFRAEVYNALNHPSFGSPNTSPTSSAFGYITGTTNEPRQWQLAGRLTF
jgi:hypothetical protein